MLNDQPQKMSKNCNKMVEWTRFISTMQRSGMKNSPTMRIAHKSTNHGDHEPIIFHLSFGIPTHLNTKELKIDFDSGLKM